MLKPQPRFELYRDSLYCDTAKQGLPRPRHWYDTKSITKLSKFSWVKCPYIAFEGSFHAVHSPLNSEWLSSISVICLKNNNCNLFPFGVMSYRKDNSLYWRNCSLSYLIDFNKAYIKVKEFQELVDNWDPKDGDIPQHWLDILECAKETKQMCKDKFRTCRRYEKQHFGLKCHNDLPPEVRHLTTVLSRLKVYIKRFPHNKIIGVQCWENFLNVGFKNLSQRLRLEEEMEHLAKTDCTKLFNILVAFIQESCTEAKFTTDQSGNINGAAQALEPEYAMYLRLSFGDDYGSLNQLNGIKRLSERYNDIRDVTVWFDDTLIV